MEPSYVPAPSRHYSLKRFLQRKGWARDVVWEFEKVPILGRSCADCNSPECWRERWMARGEPRKNEKLFQAPNPFRRNSSHRYSIIEPLGAGPGPATGRRVSGGANMLRALKMQTRKRSNHPQGDTIYRAAAVAAALMMLAASPFF
jgi:hypothetical protein